MLILDFLKILKKIRQITNGENYKKHLKYAIAIIITISLLSMLFDYFLPWNVIFNLIRCIFVIPNSILLFALVYSTLHKRNSIIITEKFRNKFTFRQRVNLCILIGVFSVFLHLLVLPIGSKLYSLGTTFLLVIFYNMILFLIPSRDEYNSEILDLKKDKRP